jgi:hypothetical protein
MAPKSNIEAQANFDFDHGKAVLCSNIHQRAIRNDCNNKNIPIQGIAYSYINHRGQERILMATFAKSKRLLSKG